MYRDPWLCGESTALCAGLKPPRGHGGTWRILKLQWQQLKQQMNTLLEVRDRELKEEGYCERPSFRAAFLGEYGCLATLERFVVMLDF